MNLKDITKNINKEELRNKMIAIKVVTLMAYLSSEDVKKCYGCDYEFDVVVNGNEYIPEVLHIWVGKNHNYKEKYHKQFEVPSYCRISLI